jgi:hypothetical protein
LVVVNLARRDWVRELDQGCWIGATVAESARVNITQDVSRARTTVLANRVQKSRGRPKSCLRKERGRKSTKPTGDVGDASA